ncbi:hypothetical protein ONZ45_g6866 [Pleurotus djamor]|nr:hypothetical protein ONZ45_g6866 [Pleurotus djamor]
MAIYQRISLPREQSNNPVTAYISRLRRQHKFRLLHRLFACNSDCAHRAVQGRIQQILHGQAPEAPVRLDIQGNHLHQDEGNVVFEVHYLEPGEYLVVIRVQEVSTRA